MRRWVIELGIRKYPRPYRRLRGGCKIFHRIATISIAITTRVKPNSTRTIDHMNLKAFKQQNNENIVLSGTSLNCVLANCRSIINRTQELQLETKENNLDICVLTETWMKPDDNLTHLHMCPDGYKSLSLSRQNCIGGGIAIMFRNYLNIKEGNRYEFTSMECTDYILTLPRITIKLGVIYRPPDNSVLDFVSDFADYMECNTNIPGEHVKLGDFNLHLNNESHQDTSIFKDTLDSFGLENQIRFATHHLQNTLDLIITNERSQVITNTTQGWLFSDHHLIFFKLNTGDKVTNQRSISYHKIKDIDVPSFIGDIEDSGLSKNNKDKSLTNLISLYNTVLQSLLDKHAPLKIKKISDKKKLPWFSDKTAAEIRLRRRLENIWRKNRTHDNYINFCWQRRIVSNLMDSAERRFFLAKLLKIKPITRKSIKYAFNFLEETKIYLYHQTDQIFNWLKISINFLSTKLDSI